MLYFYLASEKAARLFIGKLKWQMHNISLFCKAFLRSFADPLLLLNTVLFSHSLRLTMFNPSDVPYLSVLIDNRNNPRLNAIPWQLLTYDSKRYILIIVTLNHVWYVKKTTNVEYTSLLNLTNLCTLEGIKHKICDIAAYAVSLFCTLNLCSDLSCVVTVT